MPMPYQVAGKGPYQVQGQHNGRWVNGKDMSYDTLTDAWRKVIELIEKDMLSRIPETVRTELAKKVMEMKKNFHEGEGKKK